MPIQRLLRLLCVLLADQLGYNIFIPQSQLLRLLKATIQIHVPQVLKMQLEWHLDPLAIKNQPSHSPVMFCRLLSIYWQACELANKHLFRAVSVSSTEQTLPMAASQQPIQL